jgi:hypothetical protein
VEVESWLKSLNLAQGTRSKIRNVITRLSRRWSIILDEDCAHRRVLETFRHAETVHGLLAPPGRQSLDFIAGQDIWRGAAFGALPDPTL